MKDFTRIFEKSGYKMTKPRIAVLDFLSKSDTPVSAQNIHKKLRAVDLASIYRTLHIFEELHIVQVELFEKEKTYCLAEDPHHHIICKKCGYMEKIECNHNFGKFKNFSNVHHQLTLTGVCNKCTT